MRIALLGTRGIPANYGGFETFVELREVLGETLTLGGTVDLAFIENRNIEARCRTRVIAG